MEFRKTLVQLLAIPYSVMQVVWDWPRLGMSPSPLATMEKWITPLLSVVCVFLAIGLTWGCRKPGSFDVRPRVAAVVVLVLAALLDFYLYVSYVEYVESTQGVEWIRTRYYIQSVLWAIWIAFFGAAFAILADLVWRLR